MDQGQGEADRNPGETGRRSLRRRADNDEEEEKCHHHFDQEAAAHTVLAGAQLAIAVGGKAAGDPAGLARRDQPQDYAGDNRADDLGNDVRDDVPAGTTTGAPQADRDRRVEVPAGDMTYGIG